ncbi:MAG: heparinase, partial [Bacteroidales bacterium]|nr:heparinase [Bacteroidales bacterium]
MKHLSAILIALVLLISGPAARAYSERNLLRSQCSEESLKEILVPADEWMPFPKYSDRQGWDRLLGEWKEEYIKRGEKALEYNWQVTTVSDYLTCRNGGSQGDAVIHFQPNVMSVVDLFFAELAQGEGRYINKLMDGVFSLCETSSWVLSHHLHLQKSRYSFPLASDSAVDLVAGDVGSILAWVYYFFKDEFNKIEPEVSRRVKAELYERIIEPYMKDTYWWMGKNYEPGKSQSLNNWTPWCCVNCIQVFALVCDDRDLYAKAVWESMTSVDYYLNTIEGDGACDEGPSYWQQGPAKNFEYLRFIDLITGGKITLYENPMIKAMGEYIARSYIGDGWVVNFADASARGGGDPVVVHYYGRMVESPLMMRYAAYLQQNKPLAAPRDRFIIRMFYSL